ncbi:MAG: hypothetical protein R6T91_02665 [Bacteroidales bacterium]
MNRRVIFLIMGMSFFFAACNVAYIPNRHNVPLMQEQGDASVSISTTNLQTAYAFSDHGALMGNLYFRQNRWNNSPDDMVTTSSTDYQSNRFLGELGLGYYKDLGEGAVFELYGGGGLGNIGFKTIDANPILDRKYHAKMAKVFLQPNIGFKSEYIDVVLSTRLSILSFRDVDTTNYTVSSLTTDNLIDLDQQPYFFLEPALTMRFGYRFINAYAQAIVASKLNPERINYRSFGINVGIELDLGKIIYNL